METQACRLEPISPTIFTALAINCPLLPPWLKNSICFFFHKLSNLYEPLNSTLQSSILSALWGIHQLLAYALLSRIDVGKNIESPIKIDELKLAMSLFRPRKAPGPQGFMPITKLSLHSIS